MFSWWVTRPYVICLLFTLLFHLQPHLLLLLPSRPHRCLFPRTHQAYLCLMASALAIPSVQNTVPSVSQLLQTLAQVLPSQGGQAWPSYLTLQFYFAQLYLFKGLFTHLYYLLIYDAYWWLSVSPHWNIAPQMQRSPSLPFTWNSAWQIFFGMTEFYLK